MAHEPEIIGVDHATEPSRTVVVVYTGSGIPSKRMAAQIEIMQAHGVDVSVRTVEPMITGIRAEVVVFDDPALALVLGKSIKEKPDIKLKFHQTLPSHPRSMRKTKRTSK